MVELELSKDNHDPHSTTYFNCIALRAGKKGAHPAEVGWTLATVSAWKNSVNATVGGVEMLIGPRALKTLNSIERIQPRIMAATFTGNPKATIICYQC